jgi:hypothetical protein
VFGPAVALSPRRDLSLWLVPSISSLTFLVVGRGPFLRVLSGGASRHFLVGGILSRTVDGHGLESRPSLLRLQRADETSSSLSESTGRRASIFRRRS